MRQPGIMQTWLAVAKGPITVTIEMTPMQDIDHWAGGKPGT